jgi:hypothetical protein
MTTASRNLNNRVVFLCDDQTLARIDSVARNRLLSNSAWLRTIVADHLNAERETPPARERQAAPIAVA